MDELDIDNLKNVTRNLSNFKSKIDKLDVDKLVLAPIDLSKLSNEVKNHAFKNNAKIQSIVNKILDITNLATDTTINAKKRG